MKTIIYSLNDLQKIVSALRGYMLEHRILAFTGSLGAGKTTLIRSLLQACGVTGIISSPTFTYVNLYTNSAGDKFYHFDLYRIATMQEFIDAGFDEYLTEPHAYILIEWPEVIMPLLNDTICFIWLEYISENQRSIKIS